MRRAPRGAGNQKRQAIIDACRRMTALGIHQDTSGNVGLRHREGVLRTN